MQASMPPFTSIAVYASPGASAFGLGMVGEVFANRSCQGLPALDLTVFGDTRGVVRTDFGLTVQVKHGLERLAAADLVVLLPGDGCHQVEPSASFIAALRASHDRGAIVVSHCVGSYWLAATGLLDGARATTHWRLAADLAARYPAVKVERGVLYVDEGRIITGAGAAAGLDLYLYLLRREHGAAVANAIARDIVAAPHRDGGQAQYIASPVPAAGDDRRLMEVMAWATANMHQAITVDDLAGRALMSPRTFARRFNETTGTTPHSWLLNQRLNRAEDLLETTDLSIEAVARQIGYTSAVVLRKQFRKRHGVSPRAYRNASRRLN